MPTGDGKAFLMHVFITGATGWTGSAIVADASAEQDRRAIPEGVLADASRD